MIRFSQDFTVQVGGSISNTKKILDRHTMIS